MDKRQSHIPAPLEKLQKRFNQWRQTHTPRSRLPDELYNAAVKMAGVYGMYRTIRTLRLDYYLLKKRIESQANRASDPSKPSVSRSNGVRFVELAASPELTASSGSPGTGGCECSVEWEDAAGAKMRVHLKGATMPDLAALSRSFWEPAS